MSNLSIVPIRAYFDIRITQADLLLLGVICAYTDRDGFCYPSLATISKTFSPLVGRTGSYSDSAVSRRMRRLEMLGYLLNPEQRRVNSSSFSSNRYKILYDSQLPKEFDRRPAAEALANPPVGIQAGAPVENASAGNQAPVANPPVEMQAALASASVEMQANAPALNGPALNAPDKGAKKRPAPPVAVETFRDVRGKYPPRELWGEISATIGERPDDLDLWRRVLVAYAARGFNRQAIDGPLEYFRRGEIPAAKRNGNGHGAPELVPIPAGGGSPRRRDYSDRDWRRLLPRARRAIIALETGRELGEVEDDPDFHLPGAHLLGVVG